MSNYKKVKKGFFDMEALNKPRPNRGRGLPPPSPQKNNQSLTININVKTTRKMDVTKNARVIKVGDRFFARYKNKRIQTAWTLAGAKFFQDHLSSGKEMEYYENILRKKGYKFERRSVVLIEDDGCVANW